MGWKTHPRITFPPNGLKSAARELRQSATPRLLMGVRVCVGVGPTTQITIVTDYVRVVTIE